MLPIKIGDRYFDWEVIAYAENNKFNKRQVLCKCKCGNIRKLVRSELQSCRTTMCRECAKPKTSPNHLFLRMSMKDLKEL